MTKKDYTQIAQLFSHFYNYEGFPSMDKYTILQMIDKFCDLAMQENPKFKAEKFRKTIYGKNSPYLTDKEVE